MIGILRIKDMNGEWQDIQAIKGATGPAGKDGINGTNGKDGKDGTDYILTANDKQEIAEIVLATLPVYNGEVV